MNSHIAAYITLLVPVPSLIGFDLALFFAFNRSLPVERRRVLFNRAAYVPLIASVCVFVPSAALFYHSLYLSTWFGGSKVEYILFAILAPAITLAALLPLIRVIKKKLSLTSDEPDLRPINDMQRIADLNALMSFAVFAVFLIYAFYARPYYKAVDVSLGPAFIIRMIMQLFMMIGLLYYISPIRSSQISEELTKRACELAAVVGCRMPVVRLITGSAGQNSVIALAVKKSRIYLSSKLVDALTPEELDCVIAHELGHIRQFQFSRGTKTEPIVIITGALQFGCCLLAGFIGVKSGVALGVLLGGLPGVGVYLAFRKLEEMLLLREHVADRLALETTHDLDSCISSLTKAQQLKARLSACHKPIVESNPHITKRLKALRYYAEEMGIASSENES